MTAQCEERWVVWSILTNMYVLSYLAYVRAEFPVIAYQISTTGNNEIFQIYNTSALTRPEAETVCQRCKNGDLAIISTSDIDAFVNTILANSGITSGRFWLGLAFEVYAWKWSNNSVVSYEKWAVGHPASGNRYVEADIADGLWYSQNYSHRQSENSFVICQYTNSDVGILETWWSAWEKCDVITEYQVRSKLCITPASDAASGCTCEQYEKDYQTCSGVPTNIQENSPNIYQLYETPVNWYEAKRVCGRCETGRIVQQPTEADKDFIVNNVVSGFDAYFVGLTTELVLNIWTWLDMSNLTWDNWAPFNPSSDTTNTVACSLKMTSHQWYSCKKQDTVNTLVCQYDEAGKGTFGEWQPWGPCVAMPWIGSGQRYRERFCISPVDTTTTTGCVCEDMSMEAQACTTAVTAIYHRENDAYVLFDASGTGMFAEQLCTYWCSNLAGILVQYQSKEKYIDIFNNLIRPHFTTLTDHYVGITDDTTEGVWRWLDGTQLTWNVTFWAPGEPSDGFLKSYAILKPNVNPLVRTALHFGTATVNFADIVVCEYAGVGENGIWLQWSTWSTCDALNKQTRSRSCTSPTPTLSGCQCVGLLTEERSCETTTTSTSTTTITTSSSTTTASNTETAATTTTTTETTATLTTSTTPSTTSSSSTSAIPPTTSSASPTTQPSTSKATSSSPTLSITPAGSSVSSVSTTPSRLSTALTTEFSGTQLSSTETSKCFCPSLCEDGFFELTLEEKVEKLIKDLTLDKYSLSATKRKKISASDARQSAKRIGISGCIILMILFSIIIIIDFRRLLICSKYCFDRCKNNDHR